MLTTDSILLNQWHAVVPSASLKPATILPARLLGENIVLWRSNDGIVAWQDKCPHRGVPLSMGKISGDNLICLYHGFAFNSTGNCSYIPAYPNQKTPSRVCVKTYAAKEKYGLIWVCLGNTDVSEIAPFSEWDNPSYRKFLCGNYLYKSSGFRAIENFLDISHFPFVHDGFLGDINYTTVKNYQVKTETTGISINNVRVWQPDPDGTGKGGEVIYHYRVWYPLTTSFVKETNANKLAIFFTVTPVDEEQCLGWMWIAMNYGYDIPEDELIRFQDTVIRQDIPIVESQQPKRLPLDLKAEFHLPCDRASIAYRQWLKRLKITFGTC